MNSKPHLNVGVIGGAGDMSRSEALALTAAAGIYSQSSESFSKLNPNPPLTVAEAKSLLRHVQIASEAASIVIEDPEAEDLGDVERSEAESALDKHADEAVMKELNQLEWLLGHTTGGDWVQSPHSNDAVIVAGAPSADIPDETIRAYGGNLVFESARLVDREFILALRQWVPGLLVIARGHEAERLANDMLVKSLITNEASRNTLRRRIEFLEQTTMHYRDLYKKSQAERLRANVKLGIIEQSLWFRTKAAFKRFITGGDVAGRNFDRVVQTGNVCAGSMAGGDLVVDREEFLKP